MLCVQERQGSDVCVHVLAALAVCVVDGGVVQEEEGAFGRDVVAVVGVEALGSFGVEARGEAGEEEFGGEVALVLERGEEREMLLDDLGKGPAAG